MKGMFFTALWLLALASLTACAPAATGTDVSAPVAVMEGETLELERGREIFIRFEFSPGQLGLEPADFDAAFWIPAGVNANSANMAGRLQLEGVRVPAGWRLELARARVEQEVETRFGEPTGTETIRIVPVLRIEIPAGAELGLNELRATLAVDGGEDRTLRIPVRVRQPAGG